jgi:drug/metabolite transporter (DMT)-like permease
MANTPASRLDRSAVGVLLGVLVVTLFSGFTLVSRLGLTSSLGPSDLAVLRFGIGGLLMLPVLARHSLSKLRARDVIALAFFGGLGFAFCAYAGFALAPAAHGAVLLHGTLPLTTYLLAGGASARPGRGGLLIIAFGIVAMASESVAQSTPIQLVGDGALLLASFSWSTYGLLAGRIGLPPAHSASIVAVLSMCAYLPVFLLLPHQGLFSIGWRELLLQAVVQGVLIGAVSIFVYSKAVALLGATTISLATAAVPCVTTLAATFFLHEVASPIALTGVALVTAGMILSLRTKSPPPLAGEG